MKSISKITAAASVALLAMGLAACEPKKKNAEDAKPQAKVEQVQKSETPRLDALERRVKSLEISRRDVRKYLKEREIEMKAKGF